MASLPKYGMLCVLAKVAIVYDYRATDISLKVLVASAKCIEASVKIVFVTHFTPAFEKWFISSIHLFA